ncbi:integrase, catalytic region, zinc finger, CCHC-type containing protein [Tanacetum coccineum]
MTPPTILPCVRFVLKPKLRHQFPDQSEYNLLQKGRLPSLKAGMLRWCYRGNMSAVLTHSWQRISLACQFSSMLGTCPKDFGPRNKQNASTNSLRKKGVTFVHETSTHNTPPQVGAHEINSTNIPGIPSTGVKGASAASRSKPRSNTKKDRTLPAKSALKQVEAHSRMNKSNEKHKNRVDSSISYKRTVINSNSNTSCKTCNKCLISVNHDQCVMRSEMCVKQSSATKVWQVKQVKQAWKATGKLFTTIGHQWRPTGRILPLGDQWPLTRNTPPKVLPTKQWKPTGRLLPLGRQCPLVRSTALMCDDLQLIQGKLLPLLRIILRALTNRTPIAIGDPMYPNLHFRLCSNAGYGGLGPNLFLLSVYFGIRSEVAFRMHNMLVRVLVGVRTFLKWINGKKYILVIVDDYSRFTWVKFLRSKDETPAFVTNLLKQLQVGLNKIVRFVRTDNGTEFVNKDLTDFLWSVGIYHEKTRARNSISRMGWLNDGFAALLLLSDNDDILKLTEQTAPVHSSSRPNPNLLTPGPISSGIVPNSAPAIPYVPPTNKDLELLFQPMFDEYFETPTGDHQMPHVPAVPPPVIPTGPSISISFDNDEPSGSHSLSSLAYQSSSVYHGVATEHSFEVNPFAATEHEPFVNVFAPDPNSEASASGTLTIPTPNQSTQPHEHLRK